MRNSKFKIQNSKFTVTFLTGEYPPMQGGIADYLAHLANHLAPLGVESSILISRRWQKEAALLDSNDSTLQDATPNLKTQNPKSKIQNPPVQPIIPNWGWRCWPAIAKYLAAHQPDVLHIQYQAAVFDLGGWVNWLPWYLRKKDQISTKIVVTFHDLRIPYLFPKAGPLRWKSILALAGHSHAVICTNRQDLKQLSISNYQLAKENLPPFAPQSPTFGQSPHLPISQSSNLPISQSPKNTVPSITKRKSKIENLKSKILTHIPLGPNVEPQPPKNFDRTARRAKYQADGDTLLLAYFGFLNESKGGEELIEALALLRRQGLDAHLLFIGGEVGHADPTNIAYAQKVQALIDRYELADFVHRTGYVELPEVSANLLAADAVVMPYRDGVSFRRTTLIAALRHGCPVVSTTPADPILIPEIEPGENILLAPPKNAAALAQTIAMLAGDTELQKKLAGGTKALGGLFEWDRIASQTAELYRAVLSIE